MSWLSHVIGRAAASTGLVAVLLPAGCSLLPDEVNLSPLFRQRLDADGAALEVDVLWPVFHYERTAGGGHDFRIRPLYRVVSSGERREHQFLWPLGRVVTDAAETDARIFPLWTYRSRGSDQGRTEIEWAAPYPIPIWPFVAGGREARPQGRDEPYFGIHFLWADLPGYLTYDRFRSILFPLYLGTVKGDLWSHNFLFWLIGFGGRDRDGGESWHRALPLYATFDHPGVRSAHALLWPLFTWGNERLDTDDPEHRFLLWPLYGRQWSDSGSVAAWSVLWPFFQKLRRGDDFFRLDLLWPIFRYHRDDRQGRSFHQWWLWPLLSRTVATHQQAWSVLWPLVWWRRFQDPRGEQTQFWALPLWWWIRMRYTDGGEDRFTKLWPLWHDGHDHDDTGGWQVLSPWFWRNGNATGMDELYGFAWTLARSRQRAADDDSVDAVAHIYSSRTRGDRRWVSVPWLFSWVGDRDGNGTLRLLQCIPIRFGGGGGS